jgi:hypothetical protein
MFGRAPASIECFSEQAVLRTVRNILIVTDLEPVSTTGRLPKLSVQVQSSTQIGKFLLYSEVVEVHAAFDQEIKVAQVVADHPLGQWQVKRLERGYAYLANR